MHCELSSRASKAMLVLFLPQELCIAVHACVNSKMVLQTEAKGYMNQGSVQGRYGRVATALIFCGAGFCFCGW